MGGQFMRDTLILNEAVFASRVNGLLIQMHGFEVSTLDSTDFSRDQRCAVREIFRAICCPTLKTILVSGDLGQMRSLLLVRCSVIISGVCQRVVKMVLERFKKRRRH